MRRRREREPAPREIEGEIEGEMAREIEVAREIESGGGGALGRRGPHPAKSNVGRTATRRHGGSVCAGRGCASCGCGGTRGGTVGARGSEGGSQ